MAFINLELYFRDLFAAAIVEAGTDDRIIADLFSDRPEAERSAVQQYFSERRVLTDMNEELGKRERGIYVLESFPLGHLPFPQIGVYLGGEDSQDFMLGQETGAPPVPVLVNNEITNWDTEKGYYAGINYRADIIANSKAEVIWLSRICQRAIASNIMALEAKGVIEARISAGDTKPEQEHYPALVFSRAVIFTGKSLHTWTTRVPVYNGFEIGNNTEA
jgi:hypothetical protein